MSDRGFTTEETTYRRQVSWYTRTIVLVGANQSLLSSLYAKLQAWDNPLLQSIRCDPTKAWSWAYRSRIWRSTNWAILADSKADMKTNCETYRFCDRQIQLFSDLQILCIAFQTRSHWRGVLIRIVHQNNHRHTTNSTDWWILFYYLFFPYFENLETYKSFHNYTHIIDIHPKYLLYHGRLEIEHLVPIYCLVHKSISIQNTSSISNQKSWM